MDPTWFVITKGQSMETISSWVTLFVKFIFAPLLSGSFAVMALLPQPHRTSDLRELGYSALMWFIVSAFLWWTCAPLKRVRLDGKKLVISNYFEEVTVPPDNIGEVYQHRFAQLKPVTITFKKRTRFGRAITFVPREYSGLFAENEIVSRLRRLANC